MSTAPPTQPPPAELHGDQKFEKIVSHSALIYWWPVWLVGFFMALMTYVDGDRAVIVSHSARLIKVTPEPLPDKPHRVHYELTDDIGTRSLDAAKAAYENSPNEPPFRMHMSHRTWMGPVFLATTLLVILITNVPLRGLWSIITILVLVFLVIVISILRWWDDIFNVLGGLHIYMNMAGYLFVSLTLFGLWALTVFVYDERKYILFTPGQMRVCLEIGAGEDTYDVRNMVVKKQQDDLFRHRILGLWFLGLGSGDLIINTAGARQETIVVPNVWRVSQRLARVQEMQRDTPIVAG
jgi:hypothetical protein